MFLKRLERRGSFRATVPGRANAAAIGPCATGYQQVEERSRPAHSWTGKPVAKPGKPRGYGPSYGASPDSPRGVGGNPSLHPWPSEGPVSRSSLRSSVLLLCTQTGRIFSSAKKWIGFGMPEPSFSSRTSRHDKTLCQKSAPSVQCSVNPRTIGGVYRAGPSRRRWTIRNASGSALTDTFCIKKDLLANRITAK